MKRATFAVTAAAAVMAAGAALAQTPAEDTLKQQYREFRENSVTMLLGGQLDGVKDLYNQTLATDFKGKHVTTISVALPNEFADTGDLTGKPNQIVFSAPKVALTFTVATDKAGYISMIEGLNEALTDPTAPPDIAIGAPIVMSNITSTVDVQSVTIDAATNTAVVNSTVKGVVETQKIVDDLGVTMPPEVEAVEVTLNMDCKSVLALDGKGGFTVKSEECTGGIDTVAKTKDLKGSIGKMGPMMPMPFHP